MALGRRDGTIQLLDLLTKAERRVLSKHDDAVQNLAFTPDGKTLISGAADGSIKLWEIVTGTERASLIGHGGGVTALSLRSDGRTLASGSADTSILLWDLLASPSERRGNAERTATERQALWTELCGKDAVHAHRAICLLVHEPRAAVALLQDRLASVKGLDAGRIDRLIAGLDSEQFNEREKASRDLDKLRRWPSRRCVRLSTRGRRRKCAGASRLYWIT